MATARFGRASGGSEFHVAQQTVRDLKADPERDRVWYDDEIPGFGVRVTKAGLKSFVLNYYAGKHERRYTIGRCGDMHANRARKKATDIRGNKADPLGEREKDLAEKARAKAEKERVEAEIKAANENTIKALADDYMEGHAKAHKRKKSIYEDRRMLNKIIVPKLGALPVSEVSKRDVRLLHNSLRKTPYQANRILALLSKMFTLAMEDSLRPDNPAKGVSRFHEDKRETWLPVDRLQALSDALDAYAEQDAADALRLLIVTGARPDEVLTAEWPMFNLQRGIWTKPSHHTKERKLEHVPLNGGALLILRRMAQHRTGIHLFPGRESADPKKKRSARTTVRNAWRQVCRAAGLATEHSVIGKRGKPLPRWKPSVRVYDLRHTFASHLVSRNWSLPLIGKLLGQVRPETTARYAHISDGAQREVANDFDNVIEMKKLPEKIA